jgi:hypothetical protein
MADKSLLLEGKARIFLGAYLYLLPLPLVCLLVALWPTVTAANLTAPVEVQILWPKLTLTREQALLWAVATLGALGGSLHAVASFSVYTGNRVLKTSWAWWYLARWPVGAGLALVFYMVLRAGLLNVAAATGQSLDALNPYGVGTVAALAGLFSEVAMRKLREVFETLFRPASSRDPVTDRAPKLSRVEPDKVAAGSGDTVVKLIGEDFELGDVPMLDGVALAIVAQARTEFSVTLPKDKLAEAGELSLTLRRGGPAGVSSEGVKLTVTPAPPNAAP